MKTIRFLTLATLALLGATCLSAQTADEIIEKYLESMGGKAQLTGITSMFTEATLEVMGSQGTIKSTLLVGKGRKDEIDVMGTQVVSCITDTAGWTINPMAGAYNAETMSEMQYKASKDGIYIAGPFMDYNAKGYKAELIGQETVLNVNAFKITVTSPDSIVTDYFFDPETFYLIKTVQMAEMGGQQMEISVIHSNYKKTDSGLVIPYTTETNYGGQFFLTANITKVEINQAIDPVVFAKP
jgi:hypothetical protein